MLLVPRQLRRSGMTGNVPYYGGRFTPAQAWAASHPAGPTPPRKPNRGHAEAALRHLREAGVLTDDEYDELLSRANR